MTINLWAVIVSAVVAMMVGAVWYGPLFGKKWMEIIGADPKDKKAREKMQQEAKPLYLIQFVLVLFQVWVLAFYIKGWVEASGVVNALWIWAAFVMPTVAAASMWNNDSKEVQKARFLIQAGYQLVVFILFGLILGTWA